MNNHMQNPNFRGPIDKNVPKDISDLLEHLPTDLPFSKVKDNPNLIRDKKTNAIINMNIDEYENYKSLKKIKDAEYERVNSLESEMKNIKGDITEIKNLLLKVLTNEK